MSDQAPSSALQFTAQVVSAYLSANEIAADALPLLINSVYRSLTTVSEPEPVAAQQPAVPVKKSVFPGFIICLEDGKKLQMLKRHLKISYDLTPAAYRAKWGLPSDYPMVAPNYASKRSTLAKQSGLGRKRGEIPTESIPTQLPARRARGARG